MNQKIGVIPWYSRVEWNSWKKTQIHHGLCKDFNDCKECCYQILEESYQHCSPYFEPSLVVEGFKVDSLWTMVWLQAQCKLF